MAEVRCSQCGGPLTMGQGQSVILPTVQVTLENRPHGGVGRVQRVIGDAWCGDCLDAMNRALGFGD